MSLDGTISSAQQLSSENIPCLNISPNPTSDFINVEAKGIKQLALFDSNGKLLIQSDNQIIQDETTLNIKELPSGTYILRVVSDNGFQTRKIIKK